MIKLHDTILHILEDKTYGMGGVVMIVFYNCILEHCLTKLLMSLQILGINHTTAPIEIREQVVIPENRLSEALSSLIKVPGINAAVIVSTCNRTELYCETEFAHISPITEWMIAFHNLQASDINDCIYHYQQEKAVHHILRVASGLDSMILGEPQVLGQLKNAYQAAINHHALSTYLDRLFQHTFSVAKQVRSETNIGSSPVSVAYAAVTLAQQIFSEINKQTALLIGAGKTNELVARHLHNYNVGRMIIANRNYERAHLLAKQFGAYAIELSEVPSHLAEADIVISSTASDKPILTLESVTNAARKRHHRPTLMVDIAVPRDIDPAIEKLEDIYLYSIDDMQSIIQENMKSREVAAEEAQNIIDEHVSQFIGWIRTRDAIPAIRGIRDLAETLKINATQRALQQLSQGIPPDEVIHHLAHNLTNKLIHQPCTRLREAGSQQEDHIIEAAYHLFGVKPVGKE